MVMQCICSVNAVFTLLLLPQCIAAWRKLAVEKECTISDESVQKQWLNGMSEICK